MKQTEIVSKTGLWTDIKALLNALICSLFILINITAQSVG